VSGPPLPWLEAPARALRQRLREGTLPHALLIGAAAGLGGTELASGIVAAVACVTAEGPCGACDGCRRLAQDQHPDHRLVTRLVDEDTGRVRKEITVDQVRALIAELQLSSLLGGWKTAIVDPAEAMNRHAANALLKTLEEPPAATLLVLVSSRPDRIPPTLRSRCQGIAVPRPTTSAALAWLAAQQPRADWALWLAVAGGAPLAARDLAGSSFADQRSALARELLDLPEGRGDPVRLANQVIDHDPRRFVLWWSSVVRDLIVLHQVGAGRSSNPDLEPVLRNLGSRLHLTALHRFLTALQRSSAMLEDTTVNPALLLQGLLVAWSTALAPDAMKPILVED